MSMTELSKSVQSCRQLRKFNYQRFLAFVTTLDIEVVDEARLGPRSRIGSGAYATVYSTTLLGQPNRPVAIKCIEETLSFDEERIEAENVSVILATITQELRIMAHPTLRQHPNIPEIVGIVFEKEGDDAVRPIPVMELAQGTLSTIVGASTSWNERIRLARDAADGLVALHAHNIVHGDIKGDNILVFSRDGTRVAAISDLDHASVKDDLEFIVGTTAFYAPECFAENEHHEFSKNGCPRDVYSLGLVFLALAAGVAAPDNQVQLQSAPDDVQSKYIKALIPADAPAGFFDLVHSCLAKEPTQRPTAQNVSIKLSELLGEERPDLGLPLDGEYLQLLDGADAPRLRYFRLNPISPHLAAKLFVEHLQASRSSLTMRVCIGLAAFYMGIYGEGFKPQADKTTRAIAVMQWLVKAVELGSYAALLIAHCEPFWSVLTESKGNLLFSRHQSFESPSFDMGRLHERLCSFKHTQPYAGDLLQMLQTPHATTQELTSCDPMFDRQGFFRHDVSDHFDVVDLLAGASKLLLVANANDTAQFMTAVTANPPVLRELYLAMFIAISSGSLGIVRYLVEEMGIPADSGYMDSWINEAIWWAQPDIVAYLLEKGVTVDRNETYTLPPLHHAALRNNPRLARLLCAHFRETGYLDEAFRSVASCNDTTPLSNAIALSAYKVAQEYISFGAVPDGTIGGLPVLHVALWPRRGFTPVSLLRLLIGKCPHNIVNTSLHGLATPIEIAVSTGNLAATYFLLIAGADINNSAPATAWRMLQEAEKRKSEIDKKPFIDEEGQEISAVEDNEVTYFRIRQLINFVICRRLLLTKAQETSVIQHAATADPSEDELEEHLHEELEMLPRYLVDKIWNFGLATHVQFVVPP